MTALLLAPGLEAALRLVFALLPVCLFLGSLIYLDSYKLVSLRTILLMLGAGGIAAGVSWAANSLILRGIVAEHQIVTTFVAPLVEEAFKAIPLFLMIRAKRVGFLVDAAIYGFAVGTGFAVVENIYYMIALDESSVALWVVRGCGTAVMHGGSTAIVGMVTKAVSTQSGSQRNWFVLPGLAVAYLLHAFFNSFIIPPIYSALVVIALFPPLLIVVFAQSERHLRAWLGTGFDLDSDLLATINSGEFTSSPAGQYLQSLRRHFEGATLADMLCLLRIHAELSLRARGILMMREAGFPVKRDDEINEKLAELRYLERSIGRTGELAMAPILQSTAREVWALRMLEEG